MKLVPWLLMLLCLTGCLRSKVLLEDPAKCVFDEKLIGFWSMDRMKMITAIGPSNIEGNPAELLCLQKIYFTEKGQLQDSGNNPRSEYAFSVTIGNYGYICVLEKDFSKPGEYAKWLDGKDQSCVIYRYRSEKNTLTLWMGDAGKLAQNGLKFETEPGVGNAKTFAGSREELIEFLKSKSDKLFPDEKKIVFKRVAL